jgi:hypothetical protein
VTNERTVLARKTTDAKSVVVVVEVLHINKDIVISM